MTTKTQLAQQTVLTPPVHDGLLQRKCACGQHTVAGGECDQCRKDHEAPPAVGDVLAEAGHPLDADTLDFLEPRMEQDFSHTPLRVSTKPAGGISVASEHDPAEAAADAVAERAVAEPAPISRGGADLSRVRVHTGSRAEVASQAVNARAFTVGNHVVFNAGEYRPGTLSGRLLIAHELAHVLQQSGGRLGSGKVYRKADASKQPTPPGTADDRDATPSDQPDKDNKPPESDPDLKSSGVTPPPPPLPPPSDTGKAADQVKSVAAGAQGMAAKTPGATDADKAKDPEGFADIATSGIALIDEELAEHERWGVASALVGEAGSVERAAFIADEAAGGAASGFGKGLAQGAITTAGIKGAEWLVNKGALALAARFAPQVTKFTPLPAVGAVIGGVMAAYDLASRDWGATGETIGRFGQGSDEYEKLANSIESISTVLEIVTSVLNVIAGIIGAISIAVWAITIVTVGIASPLAGTLSSIAVAIGLATLVLDGINSLVLKPLVAMFRALHTFSTDADPRDVVTQGDAIAAAAGAAGGFAGGLLGAKGVEHGIHLAAPKSGPKIPGHPDPPAKSGKGPSVTVEPPEGGVKGEAPASGGGATENKPPATDTNQPASVEGKPADTAGQPAIEVKAEPKPDVETKPAVDKKPPVEAKPVMESKPPDTAKPIGEGKTTAPSDKPVEIKPGVVKRRRTPPAESVVKPVEKPPEASEGTGSKADAGEKHGAPPEKRRSTSEEIQESMQQDIEKHGGNQVDPELKNALEKLPDPSTGGKAPDKGPKMSKAMKDYLDKPGTDPNPHRSKPPKEVVNALRRKARQDFGKVMQAWLKNMDAPMDLPAAGENLLRATNERLTDADRAYIRKNGKLPSHVEFHHLMAVADFPEWAGEWSVGMGLPKDLHVSEGHGYNTRKPIEAATLANPDAGRTGEFQIDPESVKAQKETAAPETTEEARETAKQKQQDQGIKIQVGKEIAKTEREIAKLQNDPSKAGELKVMQKRLADLKKWQDASRQKPVKPPATPAPATTAANKPAAVDIPATTPPPAVADTKVTPEDVVSTSTEDTKAPGGDVSPNQPGAKDEPGAAPQPGSSPQPESTSTPEPDATAQPAAPPTKLRIATPEPEPPKIRVAEDTAAAEQQADIELRAEAEAGPAPTFLKALASPNAAVRYVKSWESVKQLRKNVKATGAMDPGKMSQGEKVANELGGPIAAYATRKVNEGIAKAKAEPVVEHVNPHYAPPPCKPQDIVTIENHILDTLAERARMEDASKKSAQQEKHHKDNQEPLANLQKGTGDAISATEAHKKAVERRGDANNNAQKKEGEVKSGLDSYEERSSQLSRLKFLLKGFERFTSLAYSLPDDPGVLVNAKRSIIKMNKDSKNFLTKMDEIETTMTAQKTAQGDRKKQFEKDAGTIKDTGQKANDSGQTLDGTKQDAEDTDKDNKTHLDDATKLKNTSNQIAGTLDANAKQKKTQAQTMAADLQAWAQNHKKARTDAIEATKQKYIKQGYKIVEVKEL